MIRKISVLLTVAVIALFACSCTKNNGDIGFWFGQWRVEKIEVDGAELTNYSGNMFFSFQNVVVEEKLVTSDHYVEQAYGHWEDGGNNAIILYFDDKSYPPVDGYMKPGANELKYERQSSTTMVLSLDSGEKTVVYHLLKW